MPDTPGADDRAQQQRRQVWSGCQSAGGCLVLVAGFVGLVFGIEVFLRRLSVSAESGGTVVFADFKAASHEIVYVSLFALMVLIFGVAVMKTARRTIIALVIGIAGFVATGSFLWYRSFAAIQFHEPASIELQYLWPKPDRMLDVRKIVATDADQSSEPATPAPVDVFRLVLRMEDGATYRSMNTRDDAKVAQARERIGQMQARLTRGER